MMVGSNTNITTEWAKGAIKRDLNLLYARSQDMPLSDYNNFLSLFMWNFEQAMLLTNPIHQRQLTIASVQINKRS